LEHNAISCCKLLLRGRSDSRRSFAPSPSIWPAVSTERYVQSLENPEPTVPCVHCLVVARTFAGRHCVTMERRPSSGQAAPGPCGVQRDPARSAPRVHHLTRTSVPRQSKYSIGCEAAITACRSPPCPAQHVLVTLHMPRICSQLSALLFYALTLVVPVTST
jgi:hypothetical protein